MQNFEEVGFAAVMPLGSPIGSNQGLASKTFLEIIIDLAKVPVIVDAGLGRHPMLRKRWSFAPMLC